MKNKNNSSKKKNSEFENATKCSLCESDYVADDILIIDEGELRTTIHAICQKCLTASIITISTGPVGAISIGMPTDLQQDEAKEKFLKPMMISADEIIDMHEYISGSDIRMIELVGKY